MIYRVPDTHIVSGSYYRFWMWVVAFFGAATAEKGWFSEAQSAVAVDVAISVDRRHATKGRIEHFRTGRKEIVAHKVDHALHGFSFIHRVSNHTLQSCAKPDGVVGFV